MNPFSNMTPAMIDAHNARVAQRRADYAKGNPFSEPGKAIASTECGKGGVDRESKLRAEILAFCAKQWPVWLVVSARPDQRSTVAVGSHDLSIWVPGGDVIAIELKKKDGKLSPAQQAWARQMAMLDTMVYVVRSFADFESILRDKNYFYERCRQKR